MDKAQESVNASPKIAENRPSLLEWIDLRFTQLFTNVFLLILFGIYYMFVDFLFVWCLFSILQFLIVCLFLCYLVIGTISNNVLNTKMIVFLGSCRLGSNIRFVLFTLWFLLFVFLFVVFVVFIGYFCVISLFVCIFYCLCPNDAWVSNWFSLIVLS